MDALSLALLLAPLPSVAAEMAPDGPVALPLGREVVSAVTSSRRADPIDRWRGFIAEASLRFGIPSDWIVRVMRAESGGYRLRKGRPIRSPKGAMGLMQLMPGTWATMRKHYGLGADPDDPRDNILAGTAYLRLMYDRFGYPGLFAAYNAGPGRYAAYLRGEAQLPRETIAYLAQVTGDPIPPPSAPNTGARAETDTLRDPLFAVRTGTVIEPQSAPTPAPDSSLQTAPAPTLFAIRRDDE